MTAQIIDVGKQIRYNRIVSPETGKTVIVPLDHGIILGPVAGIEDPSETVRKVVAGGASAVIFNTGLAPSIYSAYMNRCGAICNLINSITAASEAYVNQQCRKRHPQWGRRRFRTGPGRFTA